MTFFVGLFFFTWLDFFFQSFFFVCKLTYVLQFRQTLPSEKGLINGRSAHYPLGRHTVGDKPSPPTSPVYAKQRKGPDTGWSSTTPLPPLPSPARKWNIENRFHYSISGWSPKSQYSILEWRYIPDFKIPF